MDRSSCTAAPLPRQELAVVPGREASFRNRRARGCNVRGGDEPASGDDARPNRPKDAPWQTSASFSICLSSSAMKIHGETELLSRLRLLQSAHLHIAIASAQNYAALMSSEMRGQLQRVLDLMAEIGLPADSR